MALKFFHFHCHPILPLVYDDSLSYYEVLCKVVYKLNEAIKLVNELQESVEELSTLIHGFDDRITANSNAIAQLQTDLAALTVNVNNYRTELLNMLDDVEDKLSGRLDVVEAQQAIDVADIAELKNITDDLQAQIDKWNDLTGDATKALKAYVDQRVAELKLIHDTDMLKLDAIIKDILEQLAQRPINDVYNYPLASRVNFDVNNWQLYNDLTNALTANEYCELNLSADDYLDYDITAMNYLRNGRKMLHYDYVYMPVSGAKQEVSNAMTEALNWIWGTLSAAGYADLQLTADEYAALALDNNQYRRYYKADGDDVASVHDFIVSNGQGITSGVYKTLQTQN